MQRDDSLWKAILEDIFDDFLRFFFPEADERFDMDKGFEYLDKELEQLFPPEQDEFAPRYVDKLVKVFTRQNTEEWILVHVEVQGYKDPEFARRMFQYYSRIYDKYNKPITAVAIFTDTSQGYEPAQFEQTLLGTHLLYRYNTYKILNQPEVELKMSNNPFAMVVLIAKTALLGKKIQEQQLLERKVELARLLIERNISKTKIRSLLGFLRYYIRFEKTEMVDNFEKAVNHINQQNTTMGIEEFLIERAKREGRKEGREEGVELANRNNARRLKELGVSYEIIAASTGLSLEEIEKL